MSNESRPRVLYVVYWGAAEPLGQSLVVPAVKCLAGMGADLTLVTFDKPAELERRDDISRIRESLTAAGVRWISLRYHKSPKASATAFDVAHGCARSIAASVSSRFDIIHARTFIGGLMGITLAPLLRAKVIYHNEGFYPDEQVDGGVWKMNSMSHRLAKTLEEHMYGRADGIITMSHRGSRVVQDMPAVRRRETPVIVVPSCVDLDHFRRRESSQRERSNTMRFVYVGSVGGRYILDKAGRFVAIAKREFGRAHLRVLTRQDAGVVASMLATGGLTDDAWSIDAVPHSAMPLNLADQDAGLFFLEQGLSEHGCSPTKIGEYWAMGLPVVTTPNVSDTDEIIRRERVGVIVSENSDGAYLRAAQELRSLLGDPELANRCRRAAETHYALEPACRRQVDLYRQLVPSIQDLASADAQFRPSGAHTSARRAKQT